VSDRESEDLGSIVNGLADRTRALLRALDRQDRLETAQAFVGWLEDEREQDRLSETAREMFLRALRVASDPLNFRILEQLDLIEAVELPDLMEQTGLARVAVSERVHDLVQCGLAVREMIGDQIRRTSLASGILGLVDEIARMTGEQLTDELRPVRAMDQGSDG
jgi:hypothetical protein